MDREQMIRDIQDGRTYSQGQDLGFGGQDRWGTQGVLSSGPDGQVSRADAEWLADQVIAEYEADQAARQAGGDA